MNIIQQSRIAIFSDLHIGNNMNNVFWHKVSIDYAKWIVSDLKSKGISEIIFTGDFFDTRGEIEQTTLTCGTEFLSKFKDFKVWMIVGNHDCLYKERATINSVIPFKHWPNVTVVDKTTTIKASNDKKLVLVPWGAKDIPSGDIIFGHFELNGFKLNSSEVCTKGEDINNMLDKAPLVISGHFHIKQERKYSKGTVLYVGSAFQLNFSDAESSKGYYILNLDTNEYEFFENKLSPKHFNLRLSELIQHQNIDEEIVQLFKHNLVKLIIDRNICPDDTEFLIKKLKLLKPANFVIDYVTNFSPLNTNKESNGFQSISIETSIGEFINLLEINNKDEVQKYILELYNKYK